MDADPVVSPADTIRRHLQPITRGPNRVTDEQALAALDALLAVGERDKAKMEQMHAHIAGLTDALELLRDSDSGERDRRQIARLTEALERIRANLTIDSREGVWDPSEAKKIARAVLADKEDANG